MKFVSELDPFLLKQKRGEVPLEDDVSMMDIIYCQFCLLMLKSIRPSLKKRYP
jgi:hypothetical protein